MGLSHKRAGFHAMPSYIMDAVHIWIKSYNVALMRPEKCSNVVDEYYGKNIAKRLRAC